VDWTGKEDKDYFVKITREAGVMIMGSKTFDTIGKPLPGRKNIVFTKDKSRKSDDALLVFTDDSPKNIISNLQAEGFSSVALIGGSKINTLFASHNLITEVHVTVAPLVFGSGLSLFDNAMDMKLELLENVTLSKDHLLLKYRVVRQ
jgi:dihydrofolate reductase